VLAPVITHVAHYNVNISSRKKYSIQLIAKIFNWRSFYCIEFWNISTHWLLTQTRC